MTAGERRRSKAAEYRARALEAETAAEATALASVRDMQIRAAQRWTELADVEDEHLRRYEIAAAG